MDLLDFEYKINNEDIHVKHKIIKYNGYDYECNKIHKKLFMRPYSISIFNINAGNLRIYYHNSDNNDNSNNLIFYNYF
jgi:hypothetical protein